MPDHAIELDQLVLMALDPFKIEKREAIMADVYKLVADPANWFLVAKEHRRGTIYGADTADDLRVFFLTDGAGRVTELIDLFRPSVFGLPPRRPEGSTVPR